MQTFTNILIVTAGVIVVAVATVGGLVVYDMAFSGLSAAQFANTQYSAEDGSDLHAYLAQPSSDGPHPAVILIHEWWGLNEDIVSKADDLAAQGYVALAVDTWRGVSTRSVPRALSLVTTTPQERISVDLDAALEYLSSQESVDAGRVAVLGFCYGGGQSLRFAIRHSQLAATILFYGRLIVDPEKLAPLRGGGPLLGIFGDRDMSIPMDQVEAFEKALADLDIKHQITVYPGVGHAFANRASAITTPGPAMDAWAETLAFLDNNVRERS